MKNQYQRLGVGTRKGDCQLHRGLGNQRFYDDSDIAKALNIESKNESNNKVIIYCRVSTNNQKPELETQIKAMETFCLNAGMPIEKILTVRGWQFKYSAESF